MRSSARRCGRGDNDREFVTDIETTAELVRDGMFERFVPGLLRDMGCEKVRTACEQL